jgi:hypothetical protein
VAAAEIQGLAVLAQPGKEAMVGLLTLLVAAVAASRQREVMAEPTMAVQVAQERFRL